jgi:hypothetical protein
MIRKLDINLLNQAVGYLGSMMNEIFKNVFNVDMHSFLSTLNE